MILVLFSTETTSFPNAVYQVMTLTALNPTSPFPEHSPLQLLFFLCPFFGLASGIDLVRSLVGALMGRHRRTQDWESATAQVCENPIVVCGLGRVGVETTKLISAKHWVRLVAIELDSAQHGVDEVRRLGVPVIEGDMNRISVLLKANANNASVVVLASEDDHVHAKTIMELMDAHNTTTLTVVNRMFDSRYARHLGSIAGHGGGESTRILSVDVSSIIAEIFVAEVAKVTVKDRIAVVGLGKVGYAITRKLFEKNVATPEQVTVYDLGLRTNAFATMHPCDQIRDKREEDAIDICEEGNGFDVTIVTTGDDLTNLAFLSAGKAGKGMTIIRTRGAKFGEMAWPRNVKVIDTTMVSANAIWDEIKRMPPT